MRRILLILALSGPTFCGVITSTTASAFASPDTQCTDSGTAFASCSVKNGLDAATASASAAAGLLSMSLSAVTTQGGLASAHATAQAAYDYSVVIDGFGQGVLNIGYLIGYNGFGSSYMQITQGNQQVSASGRWGVDLVSQFTHGVPFRVTASGYLDSLASHGTDGIQNMTLSVRHVLADGQPVTLTVVPEPGTMLLTGACFLLCSSLWSCSKFVPLRLRATAWPAFLFVISSFPMSAGEIVSASVFASSFDQTTCSQTVMGNPLNLSCRTGGGVSDAGGSALFTSTSLGLTAFADAGGNGPAASNAIASFNEWVLITGGTGVGGLTATYSSFASFFGQTNNAELIVQGFFLTGFDLRDNTDPRNPMPRRFSLTTAFSYGVPFQMSGSLSVRANNCCSLLEPKGVNAYLSSVSFVDQNGNPVSFVVTIPEPATWMMLFAGSIVIVLRKCLAPGRCWRIAWAAVSDDR